MVAALVWHFDWVDALMVVGLVVSMFAIFVIIRYRR